MNVENTRTLSSPPGGLALWIFITLELLTFAGFFLAYALVRNESPALFHESSQHLIPGFAMAHTMLLITGSFLAARALRLERTKASQSFLLAALCGGIFLILKIVEYGVDISAGFTTTTNLFFFSYYFLTFAHFLHVILGVVFLVIASRRLLSDHPERHLIANSAASYWHLVDLIWLILFPLFYVTG